MDNDNDSINGKRKSYIQIGEVYFWTATINNWKHLLKEDKFKITGNFYSDNINKSSST